MANFDLSSLALKSVCPNNEIFVDDADLPSVMVYIPKFKNSDVLTGGNDSTHPAFIVNGQEIPGFWYSKYQNVVHTTQLTDGSIAAAYSLPGEDPTASINFDTARSRCEAKGAGWHLSTNAEWAAIALWCKKNGFMPYGNNNYGKDTRESNYKAIPTAFCGPDSDQPEGTTARVAKLAFMCVTWTTYQRRDTNMEMLEQIADAFVPILCLLITAGGGYLVALLRRQTQQIEEELDNETASKYIDLATDAVEQAVTYTAQTFVDALKAEGAFTKEKQLEAFQKARDKVLEILGDTTVKALGEIYGDFDAWLDTKIEQVCRDIKVPEVEKAATTTAAATAASVASTIATTAVQQIAAEATPASEPVETEEKTE